MGRIKRIIFRGLAVISLTFSWLAIIAQPGSQPLESLEWANFNTNTGQGFMIYTPNQDGKPVYYSFTQLLSELNLSPNTDNQIITNFNYNNTSKILSLTLENGNTATVS